MKGLGFTCTRKTLDSKNKEEIWAWGCQENSFSFSKVIRVAMLLLQVSTHSSLSVLEVLSDLFPEFIVG